MMGADESTRLYLVTPPTLDADTFPARLAEALSGGSIAAVLLAPHADLRTLEPTLAPLVPMIQEAGAAALVANDTRLAGRLHADGVHIGTGIGDVRLAAESFRGKRIVGAGNINSRHTAMEAGEAGVDYVLFGRPHGDTHDAPHPKALELAEWWSEVMQVPAVMMAGHSIESVTEAAATGAAFVAVHDAIWAHEAGPAEAVRLALAALETAEERAG
jgi:thiamine-phosphate pyrophosphorylase